MPNLGKFQMVDASHWKGLTKDSHLSAVYLKQPQKYPGLMLQLLSRRFGRSLEALLAKFPTKSFESDDEYTWQVIGSVRRNVPLVEARKWDGTVIDSQSGMIGANLECFYLVFAEDWFADGETIVGNLNEFYPMKILSNPRAEGTRYVYQVELTGGNVAGIPAERLLAGERFSIEAAYVENTMSRKVGDIRFSSPTSMRNEFSTIRIQHKVSGRMLNDKLACELPIMDKNGNKKYVNFWMHNVDFQLEEQFAEYKSNALMFGRSNRLADGTYGNIGKSGNVIKQGAGILEQCEVANTHYYNEFSLRMIENALMELSSAKLELGDRTFVIHTGERGAVLLHKAIRDEYSGWAEFGLASDDFKPAQKTSSNLHSNAYRAGYQFTEFLAPNNVKVVIQVDSWYDDPVRNKIKHPTGGVASSYRFDIWDIGTTDQPNIQKCVVNNQPEYRGYQVGPFRDPFSGAVNISNASFDEDAAVVHKMATFGAIVLDPTRTMSFIPAILQG